MWLPSRSFSTLYNAGFEFANADEEAAQRIEASVTETIHELFSKLELEYPARILAELFEV